jgi:antitoxin (DNA-binding transcriptional repressor) of toxin-antitoxin stability system
VEAIAISKFKATCLAVMERVRATGRPVRVTRFGKAVVEIRPPEMETRGGGWLGAMAGTGRIVGDVVSPAGEASDWEVLR